MLEDDPKAEPLQMSGEESGKSIDTHQKPDEPSEATSQPITDIFQPQAAPSNITSRIHPASEESVEANTVRQRHWPADFWICCSCGAENEIATLPACPLCEHVNCGSCEDKEIHIGHFVLADSQSFVSVVALPHF
jgi:hypothetical protein